MLYGASELFADLRCESHEDAYTKREVNINNPVRPILTIDIRRKTCVNNHSGPIERRISQTSGHTHYETMLIPIVHSINRSVRL